MYPHLVLGSISSSGHVLAADEFTEYDEIISVALPEECGASIRTGMTEMERLINNGDFDKLKTAATHVQKLRIRWISCPESGIWLHTLCSTTWMMSRKRQQ